MRHLKTYKLFESVNTEDILFDLNDIFIDLEDDYSVIEKKLFYIMKWFDYSIKGDKVYLDSYSKINSEWLTEEDYLNIGGFSFLLDVNLDNFDKVKYNLLRSVKYLKNTDFLVNIYYSYSENTDNMKNLCGTHKSVFYLKELNDNKISKLLDSLNIKGKHEQVPKRIKINIKIETSETI